MSAVGGRAVRLRASILGDGPIVRLSIAHGLGAAADAFVSVSLAGSLFFNISPDASREQVLLYLLVTMIPLAVLAPLIGPAVDRFRHTQRYVAAGLYLFRALCCLALVSTLKELAFYPIALALLVASKASGIVKQTLVQSLVDDPDALVATNARLARFASIIAAVSVGVALVLLRSGPEWTLRSGAVLYASAGAAALTIHLRHRVRDEIDDLQFAESLMPSIVVSSIGMIAIRAAVGFFIFTLAFSLRRDSEPAYIYGLAAASYAGGAFVGHSAATLLRGRLREEQMIAAAIAAPAVFTAVGILGVSIPLLLLIAGLVGLSTTLGRNAFDALVQRVAPETMLGRAGARYETEFQLAWVFGGVMATPISLPIEVSMTVLTLMYVPGLLLFLRASRTARLHEHELLDPLSVALQRLIMARHAWEVGSLRLAIIDASSAVDLVTGAEIDAPTVHAPQEDRDVLAVLRSRAADPTADVSDADAEQALAIAARYVTPAPPQ